VQHGIVVDALKAGADIAAERGVTILLENLNTRVEHPGTLFDTTAECLAAVRAVGSPGLALLYDAYHSLQMGETPEHELAGAIDAVSHVQIADLPDRSEPGTGTVDWATRLRALRDLGYTGPFGLEYVPTMESGASPPFSADQAAGAQDAQVVGDQRLRCVQCLAQFSHPGRLVGQAE
jgi:hydroxypyruvate isomerase